MNERNKLNVYGYYSHDRFAFNDNEKYAYNNMNFSANWRTVFADKLTGNFSFLVMIHYVTEMMKRWRKRLPHGCLLPLTNGLEKRTFFIKPAIAMQ